MPKPELVVAPLTPFAGDLNIDASALQREIDWMHRGLTATMKTAMRLIGLPVGDLYPPHVSLDAGETAALADYLKTTVLAKRLTRHAHA